MATATTTTPTATPDAATEIEAVAQRVRDLGEKVAEQAKQNGLNWLEGYEKMLTDLLELEEKAAKGTGSDWATSLASAHANYVKATSDVVFAALRDRLKT